MLHHKISAKSPLGDFVVCCTFLILFLSHFGLVSAQPTLNIDITRRELGTTCHNKEIHDIVPISNQGSDTLIVGIPRCTEHCWFMWKRTSYVGVEPTMQKIAPGTTGYLLVHLPVGHPGGYRKTILLTSNDSAHPETELEFLYEVLPSYELVFDSTDINLGKVDGSQFIDIQFHFVNRSGTGCRIINIKSSGFFLPIFYSTVLVPPGGEGQIICSKYLPGLKGEIHETLRVYREGCNPPIELKVNFEISPFIEYLDWDMEDVEMEPPPAAKKE
jgi:hypothetical protein